MRRLGHEEERAVSHVDEPGLVGDVPAFHAARRPDAVALRFGEQATTWRELQRRADRVAVGLAAAGCAPGARVAFLGKDDERAYEVVFGSARAGTVLMGINWRLTPPEVAFILEDGEAEVVFVHPEQLEVLRGLVADLPRVHTVVVMARGSSPGDTSLGTGMAGGETDDDGIAWRVYDVWREAAHPDAPRHDATPEDVVVQMYTSGTTGHPKGVMLAHRSFFAVVRSMREAGEAWIGFGPDDVNLCALPTFHIGGLWWALTAANAGACNVIMDVFTGSGLLDAVRRWRVTKTCIVPAMMQVVLSEPDCAATDFTSLDHVVYGGSPIPATLLARAMETFGARFAQIYGLTETGNTAVCLWPDDHLDPDGARLLAAGRPYPCVQLKVIDDHGAELPPRAVGEICIRSAANMVGYWKREEATQQTLRDGWLHTGDAGFLDEDGYVYVHDRVKDMIIYAGENVYPAEIESVLCAHEDVAEAAVIGVPDERWGELVKALVVRRPGAQVSGRQLIAHCRPSLASFKVPKSVDFVEALPRTPSGKIQKAKLRAPYWEGRERQVN